VVAVSLGKFTGDFEVFEVNGPDIKAENDFGKTAVQTVNKPVIKVKTADKVTYSFPPHSFTMLKGKIQ
jgi:alpha-N-arabinofuranosidase